METGLGNSLKLEDEMEPGRAQSLHASFGLPGPAPELGSELPAFWHQIYFWQAHAPVDTGPDGHGKKGGFIPDFGLEQRMWAGGRLRIDCRLKLGAKAEKVSTVDDVTEKSGRAGRLVFATIRHEFRQDGRTAITEFQSLVYRNSGRPPDPRPVDVAVDHRRRIAFDPVLLFRYSALTFNSHRIHYDVDYCRDVAGYPDLVVHGPLLASLLVDEAESNLARLREFDYRAASPVFCNEEVQICRSRIDNGWKIWIQDPQGGLRMSATAIGDVD